MKKRLLTLLLAMSALSAEAAVTMIFSTSANPGEGWANSSGDKTATMVWGIIVDADGDGFDGFAGAATVGNDGGQLVTGGATYDGGFLLTPTGGVSGPTLPAGQLLSSSGLLTDDRLFVSQNPMALVNGDVRITTLNNMIYAANMAAGDKYAIVWFDITTTNSSVVAGAKYGAWYKDGNAPQNGTLMPADPGTYSGPSNGPPGLWGGDNTASTKVASLTMVPEPSAALLGLLGAGALLRRRRASVKG